MASRVEIQLSATGAAAVSKVFDDVAQKSRRFAEDLSTGSKRIESSLGSTRGALTEVSNLMGQAGVNTGILGQALGALSSPLGIAAAGMVAFGLALKQTVDFMTQNYEQMKKLVAISGLAVEEADQLADAWELLGGNSEVLTNSLFKMSAEIDSGGKALKQYEIDLRDLSGAIKEPGQVLLELRDKISQMGNAAERNAALLKFFGRAGRENADIFALSADEFKKWLEAAGKIGPSATTSMAVTKEYARAMAELNKVWQGFIELAGTKILPMLTTITKSMTLAIDEVSSWGDRTTAWFTRMGDGLSSLATDWENYWRARGGQGPLPVAEPSAEGATGGLGTSDITRGTAPKIISPLTKAEVDDIKLGLKEVEEARLNSINLIQARSQAAVKLDQQTEAQAAQQSISIGQQIFAAKAAAIDGEIAAIRRTSATTIQAGTEEDDKIRALLIQRAAAYNQMAVTAVNAIGTITKAEEEARKAAQAALFEATQRPNVEAAAGAESTLEAQQKAMAAVVDQVRILERAFSLFGDETARGAGLINVYTAAINALPVGVEAADKEVQELKAKIMALNAEMARVATFKETAETIAEAWSFVSDGATDAVKAMEAYATATGKAEQQAELLGQSVGDTLAAKITATEQAILNAAAAYGTGSEAVRLLQERLAGLKAQGFAETMAAIGREAALVGPNFDEASAKLDAFKNRILELQAIKNPTGEILSEIDQLKAKFADTQDFIKWRGMFESVFQSVGDAVNTLVQGVILGTQTMGEAFKRLGQAIITQFVNAIIQQALNPLVKAAAAVVAGLFSSGGAVAAAASSGGGINSAGFAPGEAGGSQIASQAGAAADSLGNLTFTAGLAANGMNTLNTVISAGSNAWAAFGESIDAGASIFDAGVNAYNTATTALSGFATGIGTAFAGVGAAVAAFSSVMDIAGGKLEAGIGGIVGGGILGAVGAYFAGPFGAFLGYSIGDLIGSWIGGLFGGPGNYEMKRIAAADEAQRSLGTVGGGYQRALNTGDIVEIFRALQTGAGGVGNSVRTELVLPSSLAAAIGVQGQQIGDKIVAQWSDITLEQFQMVLDAMKDNPDLVNQIRGSGDVPYLSGGDAQAIADQIAQGAQALINAFNAMQAVRDRIRDLAVDIGAIGKEILPASAGDAFQAQVNTFRDRMLAVLSSGLPVAEMQKQLDALEAELRNYTGLVDLYAQNTQLIAQLSGDFAEQTHGAVITIRAALAGANRAVAAAQTAANRAITPEAELKSQTALRDAIVKRYQLEIDMVDKIAASLESIAAKQGTVQQTLTTAAVVELGRGDATAFNEILHSLADMAMVAPTVAQRLWAVGQGLAAVLAALPTTAKTAGSDVASQIQSQVAPFFSALGDMIQDAASAGDLQGQLALLERQSDLIKEVGSALVQAVNDWAAAASDAVRTVASDSAADVNKNWDAFADASHAAAAAMRDDVTKNWDAFAEASHAAADAAKDDINKNWGALKDGVTDAAEAAIQGEQDKIDAIELATKLRQKEIDLEIKGIDIATKAQQKAIADQIVGLQAQRQARQEQIAAAKEWEGLQKSIGEFVQGLKLGSQSPMNPADQLALAQSTFDKANAAFGASPTASGATDVQKAAADLLGASQNVLTRSSPEYQELFGAVVAAMEKVQGTAASMAPVSSGDLEAQTETLDASLEALRAQSQALGEDAAARIDALREESTTLNETARDQIEVLRGGIETIRGLLSAELTRIDAARQHDLDLVDGWLKVRDAEIKAGREYDLSVVDGWLKARDQEIKDGREYDLGVVSGWLATQLASIEASRKGTVEGIQDGMIEALRKNSEDQNRILGLLEGAQREALDAVTKGVPLEQFKAKAAADTVAQLERLNTNIEQFLLGSGHATGLAYVPSTGPYKLHTGERVLTQQERVSYERGGGAGGVSISYAPTVNVSGAGDPAMIKAMVEEALRRDRRDFLRELETGAAGARLRG